ncbi:hypothetical protein llap_7139 [Limosa lapponica baueri]|uniref:Uncharacterized protein n=1 Tax=Limosa lapponica baueri TaxID=1758121 RepID=A0A2I0U959_LIMLA|nr:hypothetical protein llap_7139 [Limosa lapponica baueri]
MTPSRAKVLICLRVGRLYKRISTSNVMFTFGPLTTRKTLRKKKKKKEEEHFWMRQPSAKAGEETVGANGLVAELWWSRKVTFRPAVTSQVSVYLQATKEEKKEKRWGKRTKSKQFLEQICVRSPVTQSECNSQRDQEFPDRRRDGTAEKHPFDVKVPLISG